MTPKRRILHLVSSVGRTSFGIGPIVLNLTASQQALGHTVKIWCFDAPPETHHLESNHALAAETICSFSILGPERLGYSPDMERAIVEEGLRFEIIHQHGIWTGVSRALNRWRGRTARPTVIAPHGSLEPWALKRSHWKKRLALALYENKNLHEVSCMHALSQQEATDFRAFGLCGSVGIIPNGVPEGWMSQRHDPARFRLQHGLPDSIRIMLFLGRITPKKGLPMLLRAMYRNREQLTDWKLVIAGVDEFDHKREVQAMVQTLELQSYVQFIGPQFDQDKRDAFSAADIFVLPSHSEGAPVVILEALGAAIPVLTTKGCPWEELIRHQCGWWTEVSEDAISAALQDVLQQLPSALRMMGQRGKNLVSEKYTWSHITRDTLTLYDWLLDGGEKPAFMV